MKQSPIAMATALVKMAHELEEAEEYANMYKWIRNNWNEGMIVNIIPPRMSFDSAVREAMAKKK